MAAVTLPAAASQQARASRSYSRCAVSYGATPPRLQQRRRRRRAAAVVWAAAELPTVDWTRRSVQQILFVDRTDTVRARFAVGLLERISGWVGCSRVVQSWPCGVDAEAGSSIGWSTQASLFSLAASWQLRPHLFTSPRQRFEEDDIDRFELIVCLDSSIQAEVLKQLSAVRPAEPIAYTRHIACLHDFLMYVSDEDLLASGRSASLDRQLRGLVRLALPSLRPSAARVAAAAAAAAGGAPAAGGMPAQPPASAVVPDYMLTKGIQRPALQGSGSGNSASGDESAGVGSSSSGDRWERSEQWERMVLLLTLCVAGLVRYLLDCRPDDSPDDQL